MKGDFSRFSYNKHKNYSRILMQQGRVLLDADWNEQAELLAQRIESETRDLVGPHGAPDHNAGFALYLRKGLRFDGQKTFVWVGSHHSLSFPGSSPFTIEARIELSASSRGGVVAGKWADNDGEYILQINADRTICFLHREIVADVIVADIESAYPAQQIETELQETAIQRIESTQRLPVNRRSHVAVTYDGKKLRLFIDGRQVETSAGVGTAVSSNAPFIVGARCSENNYVEHFDGIVDELRIWKTARSETALRRTAQYCEEPLYSSLVSHWQCHESTGNEFHDSGPAENHGTLGGDMETCAPAWLTPELWISRGRYYVEGIQCHNEHDVPYITQPYTPNHEIFEDGEYILYLDVWPRFVSSIEDPDLRDIALGGADTTARVQTAWQVKARNAQHTVPTNDHGRLRARRQPIGPLPENRLYRIEVHHGGGLYNDSAGRDRQQSFAVNKVYTTEGSLVLEQWPKHFDWQPGQVAELYPDGDTNNGTLVEIEAASAEQLTLTVAGLDAGAETDQQLRLRPIASFKWSRDNGARAFAVEHLSGQSLTLLDPRSERSALRVGAWIGLSDDELDFQGHISTNSQIEHIEPDHEGRIHLALTEPPAIGISANSDKHPVLRCWDQTGNNLIAGALVARANAWTGIEDGIQVNFEPGSLLVTGDYWCIPARTAIHNIAWPVDASGPLYQPPLGIWHHEAPLAQITCNGDHWHISDLRVLFGALDDGVRRSGDTMTGALSIEAPLHVKSDATVDGDLTVGTLYGKLPPDVGTVPSGWAILGSYADPPPGYYYSGISLSNSIAHAVWQRSESHLPDTDVLGSGILNDRIYVVMASGKLWDGPADFNQEPPIEWIARAELPVAGRGAGVGVLAGRVHVVGGIDPTGRALNTHWAYDPHTDKWSECAPMPTARSHLGIGVIDGKLFALAGHRRGLFGSRFFSTTRINEAYDPVSDSWSRIRDMPTARQWFAVAVSGSRLYALGGHQRLLGILSDQPTDLVAVYTSATNTWRKAPAMTRRRAEFAAAAVAGKIYAVGGRSLPGATPSTETYDPETEIWTDDAQLNESRYAHSMAIAEDRLLALGGVSIGGQTNSIENRPVTATLFVHVKQ